MAHVQPYSHHLEFKILTWLKNEIQYETVTVPGKWSFVTHSTPPSAQPLPGGGFAQLSGITLFSIDSHYMDLSCSKTITKSLELKVLPSEWRHSGLAILPLGGGLFCPTFRYHQFDHGFQWCMTRVQSHVKICLEKFTSCDLTNVETFLRGEGEGGGLFSRFEPT